MNKIIKLPLLSYACICGIITILPTYAVVWPPVLIIALILNISCLLPYKLFLKLISWILLMVSIPLLLTHYDTILDIEAGLSLLVILQSLKLAEVTRQKKEAQTRHAFIFYNILFLVVTGQVLFDQNLMTTFMALISFSLIIIGIFKLENDVHSHQINYSETLRKTAGYFLLSLPLIVTLFIFFPRLNIGLQNAKALGQIGFSADLNPGDVAELVASDEIAFRVEFENGKEVAPSLLYWTGSTLWKPKGLAWTSAPGLIRRFPKKEFEANTVLNYHIYSDTIVNEYLFVLDAPIKKPIINLPIVLKNEKSYKLINQYPKKINYKAASALKYKDFYFPKSFDRIALDIPDRVKSERFTQLVKTMNHPKEEIRIDNIINFFQQENFRYTLEPGKIDSVDDFLFVKKRGFCEHFASVFALLARALNIPSRVVVGYQGGSYNDLGQYYIIKQRDAHAWTEIYLKEKGWVRFDPVAYIMPERINRGGQEYFSSLNPQDSLLTKFKNKLKPLELIFDGMNIAWSKLLTSYDRDFQSGLARKWGLSLRSFFSIVLILPIIILFFIFLYYFLSRKRHKPDKVLKLYGKFLKKITKAGVHKAPFEGPLMFAQKIKQINPALYHQVSPILKDFSSLRYKKFDENLLKRLKGDIKAFKING